MKRLVIRLSVLSVVVVLGLIAIAQARHGLRPTASNESKPPAEMPAGAPRPIEVDPLANPITEPTTADGAPRALAASVEEDAAPIQAQLGEAPRFDNSIPPADVVLADHQTALPPAGANDAPPELEVNVPSGGAAAYRAEQPQPLAMPTGGRYGDSAPPSVGYGDPAQADGPSLPYDSAPEQTMPLAARPLAETQPPAEPAPLAVEPTPAARPLETQPQGVPPYGNALSAGEPTPPALATPIQPTEPEAYGASPSGGLRLPLAQSPATNHQPPTTNQGRPGPKELEGLQTAGVTLQKIAPREVQVGKECAFEILVKNNGQVAARGVELRDMVPRGTRLVATEPPAASVAAGELAWDLGDLEPGQEVRVKVHLMPTEEGEIGSVATVRMAASASARVVATKPELVLRLTAEPKVLIGEKLRLSVEISNPGSGPATGVMLFENIPAQMKHPAGGSLEFEVGTLMPGETRKLDLELTAARAGLVENLMIATADANLKAQDTAEFEVVAPALDVTLQGPTKRYLERPATYTLSVDNPGTAPARDIELTTYLPQGMKFVKANNSGQYDPKTHSVSWGLAELPARQSGSVELVAVPVEPGELALRVEGKAGRGLSDEAKQTVQVEGLAAIAFSVADLQDPIARGGETTYEIRVVNQGSKASANVRLTAQIPPGLKAVSASGPTPHEIGAGQVVFAPLAELAPKADTTYHIKLQAVGPGDQRVHIHVDTDELQTPVTKEESTRVYADQ